MQSFHHPGRNSPGYLKIKTIANFGGAERFHVCLTFTLVCVHIGSCLKRPPPKAKACTPTSCPFNSVSLCQPLYVYALFSDLFVLGREYAEEWPLLVLGEITKQYWTECNRTQSFGKYHFGSWTLQKEPTPHKPFVGPC